MFSYQIDKVTFNLKERITFDWLTNLGYVFAVFDEQDSGNICFGVEQSGKKKFVKFPHLNIVVTLKMLSRG